MDAQDGPTSSIKGSNGGSEGVRLHSRSPEQGRRRTASDYAAPSRPQEAAASRLPKERKRAMKHMKHSIRYPTDYEDMSTIDWMRDKIRARARWEGLKQKQGASWKDRWNFVKEGMVDWVLCILIGILTGTVAAAVDANVDWIMDYRIGYCSRTGFFNKQLCNIGSVADGGWSSWEAWLRDDTGWTSSQAEWGAYGIFVFVSVTMAAIAALLVRNVAPYASGSGIPEVKTLLGGFVIRGYLGFWTLVVKASGLVMSVGSGLNLGKEGPCVHMACCIANLCSRMFDKIKGNHLKRREMISCASAAGVGVAFGAPIGGVLFALEEVSYYFSHYVLWRAFFCALIAALTLQYYGPNAYWKPRPLPRV